MSKRIPFDVQFLMESILSEDPDTMDINDIDAERLNAKGANVAPDFYNWESNKDAVTFWIDEKNKVVVFSLRGTHGAMEPVLMYASGYIITPDLFNEDFKEKSYMGCVGIYSKPLSTSLYFFGGGINNFDDLKKYLKKNRNRLKKLNIRGEFDDIELCGRAWRESNAISFWNTKKEIDAVMKLVIDFMYKIEMDPTKCAYEFADSRGLYGYTDLGGNVEEKDKLSREELHALQKKKHLKKNKADYGPEFWEKHGKKAAKGFDITAKADASIPALEGHIKLKDLLKENPDRVISVDNAKIAKYFDGDAVAFFAFKDFAILNPGGVHYDMFNVMRDVNDMLSHYSTYEEELQYLMDEKGFIVSNLSGMIDELAYGKLGKWFENHSPDEDDDSGTEASSSQQGAFRTQSGGLAGRLWTNKKIVSFWNRKEEVVKRWHEVEQMFTDLGDTTGDLNEYKVDWLERDASITTPLTPASEVSSASSSDNQSNFLDKLFGEKELSDEEIKKLQAKLHTLPAKEKKKVMMAMGYKNMKAAEIADKLGMTVAEFNHIMNVNESDTIG